MSLPPSWQTPAPAAGDASPPTGTAQRTAAPRRLLLVGVLGLVLDVAIAAWIAFGPMELAEERLRYPLAALLVLSGVAALFLLSRMAKQQETQQP